jgi:AcrR family transcriptional regulator
MPSTRDRLIDAAIDHLSQDGLDGLTLRAIARDAGVSHGAPARHFDGVASLLAGVAARSFDELTASIDRHVAEVGDDPMARLRAAGDGYLSFAVSNRAAYELMFRPERLDQSEPDYLRASVGAFDEIKGLVAAAQASGWNPDVDHLALTGVVWAGTHGIATLWIQGSLTATTNIVDLDRINAVFQLALTEPTHEPSEATP